jgi:hypothetical protein
MNYITGTSREQLTIFPTSLDSAVSADNEVRIIDAFVNSLDMCKLGFLNARTSTEGRPAYNPADLLKVKNTPYCFILPFSVVSCKFEILTMSAIYNTPVFC